MTQILLVIATAVLMLAGLVGVIVPVLPGIPFMFVLATVFAIITKFQVVTGVELGWLAIIMAISVVVDYLSGMIGARFGGASGKSLLIGLVGFLIGLAFFPPFGGLLGMFIGIGLSEVYFYNRAETAVRAASGGVFGTVIGIVINLILGLGFVALFLSFSI